MEFFIKKNATLPLLKFEVFQDGRSDFNNLQNLSGTSSSYLTLIDPTNSEIKFASRPCSIVTGQSEYDESKIIYFVQYQFKNTETKKLGRYEIELSMIDTNGTVILPLRDKVFVNIIDSFSIDGFSFPNNYEVDYPCCEGAQPDPTPANSPTPSISSTLTPTKTKTPTPTPTPNQSSSVTPTPTTTPTVTPTISVSPTITKTPTNTPTQTRTTTPTITPTNTVTPTITPTNSQTPAVSPSVTPTKSITPTNSLTPTITPTNSLTPTITPTTTITPTVSPSYIPPSIIVNSVDNDGVVYSYNFGTGVVTNVTPPQNSSITSKSWIGKYNNIWWTFDGYSTLYRQDGLSNAPVNKPTGALTDPGICVLDSNNVLFVRTPMSGPNRNIILGPYVSLSFSYIFCGSLPVNRLATGGMIKTTTNKLIIITTNFSNTSVYLNQYPYVNNTTSVLTSEVEVNLTNIISNPRGIFVASNQFYIVNASGEIYQIQKTSPYTVSYVTSIGRTVKGIAQDSTNWTIQFS